jgi:nucleotide-binding universal stress UspA family protein
MGDAFRVRRDNTLMEQAHARAQEELAEFTRRCRERGIDCETVVREGSVGEEISLAARTTDVVVAGHGGETEAFSPAREDLSVLDSVLTHAVQPTLVVPCCSPKPDLVVVAYDESVQAARAVHEFAMSGLWQDCPVQVISLGGDVSEVTDMSQRAAAYLRLHGYNAESKAIVAKHDTDTRILDFVNESGAGLLVMGAYGKPRWQEFFIGTVTRGVMRAIMTPVFLTH